MRKVHSQLSIIFIGLYLVCSLVLLLTAENLLQQNMQDQLIENMKTQCQLIDESLLQYNGNSYAVVDRLAGYVGARVTLIDSVGNVILDTRVDVNETPLENHIDRDEVVQALNSKDHFGNSRRYSQTLQQNLLYTAYDSPSGYIIRIAHDLDFIDDNVLKIRFILVIAATVSSLIALLSILNLSRYLTRPISQLIGMTKRIADGNYSATPDISQHNEIGELGRSIKSMGEKLRSNIEQYERVQEVRRDFIANASHELKTPVSAIKGYVETLLDGALENKQVNRRFLERALSNVERLEIIVNDMLDLSRLESYQQSRDERYIRLEDYIRNLLEDFNRKARDKGLVLNYENKLPVDFRLLVDTYHLDKAIINLMDNAVKYTETGSVTVHSFVEGGKCIIKVIDTGRGIKKEDLGRIFERFYRVDKARSRELGGSGLGLAIVKHVMEMYKGSVSVESELGKGSTFTLKFPV